MSGRLNILGIVVDVFFVLNLPEHESSLLLHVGENCMLDVQVVDGADFVDNLVDFDLDIIVHGVIN